MPDRVRKVSYCYPTLPNRAGRAAQVLGALREAGVNLLALHGFPARAGKAQLDFFAEDLGAVRRVARRHGWKLSPVKRAFLVQGTDQVGAVHRHLDKLARSGVNVTAATGLSAGGGRYAMVLWVRRKDYAKAARALGAR
ncbi:MAG: hypothetical protein ACREMX_18540 [Gemmatimonadales bacterium]